MHKQLLGDLRGIDYCDNRFGDRVRISLDVAISAGALDAMVGADWGGQTWQVDIERGALVDGAGDVIACSHSAASGPDDWANARLAAHAPELLAELRRLVKRCADQEAQKLLDQLDVPLL